MKNKNGNLFIVLIILVIILIILLSRCSSGQKQIINKANLNINANVNQENLWPDLSDCIVEVTIDYHSTAKVEDEKDAANVFNEFINWAKENNKEIFSGKGNNWRFQSAAPHGIYKNVKYWRITALWFSEQKQQWLPQIVFDVSEDGQVVRLLGCL